MTWGCSGGEVGGQVKELRGDDENQERTGKCTSSNPMPTNASPALILCLRIATRSLDIGGHYILF